jgi:hypothetical protein
MGAPKRKRRKKKSTKIAWPSALADQLLAVQRALAVVDAGAVAPADVAKTFGLKKADQIESLLASLAMLGLVRATEDGRYAA